MPIRPLGDHVVVEPLPAETKTRAETMRDGERAGDARHRRRNLPRPAS